MKKFALFLLLFAASVAGGLASISYLRKNEVDLKYISFEQEPEVEVVVPPPPVDELVAAMRDAERELGKLFLSQSQVDVQLVNECLEKIAAAQTELQKHESIEEAAEWKVQTILARSKFLASRFVPNLGPTFVSEAKQIAESRPTHSDAAQAKVLLFCYELTNNPVTFDETLVRIKEVASELDSESSKLLLFSMSARQLLFAGKKDESAQILETGLDVVTGKRGRARLMNQMLAQGHRPASAQNAQ